MALESILCGDLSQLHLGNLGGGLTLSKLGCWITCLVSSWGIWLYLALLGGAFCWMLATIWNLRHLRCFEDFLHAFDHGQCLPWAAWRPCLAMGIRFGEARHPGPYEEDEGVVENTSVVTFVTTNPTALNEKLSTFWEVVHATRAHFVAASETSATALVQKKFSAGLRRNKWRSCFSPPVPPQRVRCDGEDSLRGKALGTAAFSSLPMRVCREQLQESWRDSLRILHVVVSLGVLSLQVFVLYGLVAPTQGYASYNNSLLEAAVDASRHLPLPTVFMGDFNIEISKLPAFRSLQSRGFSSLQQCWQDRLGRDMPPTCKEATSPDTAILAPELLPMLQGFEVHSNGHWFDAHHPVSFSLHLPDQQVHRLVRPMPRPLTDFWLDSEVLEQAWNEIDPGTPPRSFEDWAGLMEDSFDVALRKVPSQVGLPRVLPPTYRGRCRVRKVQQRPILALTPMLRPGEMELEHEIHTMRTKKFFRQVRRIVSLERHLKRLESCFSDRLRELCLGEWKAILGFWCDAAPFAHWLQQWPELWPIPWQYPTLDWIASLKQLAQFSLRSMVAMDHQTWQSKQQYYRLQDKRLQNSKEAFRKLKGSTPQLRETQTVIEQTGLAVPRPDFSFVELWCEFPTQFTQEFPVYYDGRAAKILEIGNAALLVSFYEEWFQVSEEAALVQTKKAVAPEEIFRHLNEFWLPLWQRQDSDVILPHQAQEFEFFLSALDPFRCDLQLDLASVCLWQDAVNKLKRNAAPGADGVRASELQLIPPGLLGYLASLMSSSVDGFPETLMESRTVPLPKVLDNITAAAVRPITILSQLYRLWGQVICKQVLHQWSRLFPVDISGLLARRSSFSAAYLLQWQLEQAAFRNLPSAGLTLDICKCFNMISRVSGFLALKRLGIPTSILAVWQTSLARMSRRWELWGEVSSPMAASCGFPEGDVFSVLVMLAIALVWTAVIRRECGLQLALSAYADDWTWSSSASALFGPILDLTLRWTSLVGMVIDWKKTWFWATTQDLAGAMGAALKRLGTPDVQRVSSATDLGCPIRYSGNPRLGKLPQRLAASRSRLLRLRDMAEDLDVKVTMVTQGIYPCALYGAEFIPLGERHLEQLRSLTAEALVGASRCMTPCLVLLLASPRLRDPALHVILMAIAAARRFLFTCSQPEVAEFFICAASFKPKPNGSRGPASTLKAYMARLGWMLCADGTVLLTGFVRFHLLEIPWPQLLVYADWAWQDKLLTCLSEKHTLAALPNISRTLTLKALSGFRGSDRILLLREIAGAFLTNAQQAIWDSSVSGQCDHCQAMDTRRHRVLECPAYAHVRERFPRVLAHVEEVDSTWPILPVLHEPFWQELRDGIHQKMPELQFDPCLQHHLQELMVHSPHVHMYTDGSCRYPHAIGFRFTSCAVVLDSCLSDEERVCAARRFKATGEMPSSLHLISHSLGSGSQTIHRAELLALVRVMEEFAGVVLHVDSASALRAWEKSMSWQAEDLHSVRDLDLVLRLRAIPHRDCNLVVKIKAHLDPGSLPDLDCYHALGNALADHGASLALQLIPSLAKDWQAQFQAFEEELSLLQEWMTYLVALQPVRIRLSHNAEAEGLPVLPVRSVEEQQAVFRAWRPCPSWSPAALDGENQTFWHYGVWGAKLTSLAAEWLSLLQWPTEEWESFPCNVGFSWLEVTLSFLLWLKALIPVRRRDGDGEFRLMSYSSFSEALAEGVTLSELSLQCSTLMSQTIALSVGSLLPSWVARSRVKSLYCQGFCMNSYGWSGRPRVPNQDDVQNALELLRGQRPHASSWAWFPEVIFGGFSAGEFEVEDRIWRMRQLHLQIGLKEVRRRRSLLNA